MGEVISLAEIEMPGPVNPDGAKVALGSRDRVGQDRGNRDRGDRDKAQVAWDKDDRDRQEAEVLAAETPLRKTLPLRLS